MINRNFPSPKAAVEYLRGEGFKPITSKPRTWKKIQDRGVREVRLHVFGRGLKSKVVEVPNES